MKKIYIILLLLLILPCGCKKKVKLTSIYLNEAFSIIPNIRIMEEISDDIIKILQKEMSEIVIKLDDKFNVFKEKSMITEVNNNAGKIEVIVDEEFIEVIKKALEISNNTMYNGISLYDISIYTIWKEWEFKDNYYQYYNYKSPPSNDIIKQKLPLVNFKKIIVNEKYNTVFLTDEGMAIDLGSIVKGYAADKLSKYLISQDIFNFIIDVGGNIVTYGKNINNNSNWKVGILEPYTINKQIGYINAQDKSETFVTSGIYQRYIVDKNAITGEETIYHHILNPITGYPENNELLSVTIITSNSCIADALSTAVFLLGKETGIKFVNNTYGVEAIFVTKNKEIFLSEGIKKRFKINENTVYKLMN